VQPPGCCVHANSTHAKANACAPTDTKRRSTPVSGGALALWHERAVLPHRAAVLCGAHAHAAREQQAAAAVPLGCSSSDLQACEERQRGGGARPTTAFSLRAVVCVPGLRGHADPSTHTLTAPG
jgi:hypothetical protein